MEEHVVTTIRITNIIIEIDAGDGQEYTHRHTHTRTHIHTQIHTHTHTHTHIHTHTHTHTRVGDGQECAGHADIKCREDSTCMLYEDSMIDMFLER
jgi:hypothetical protein